MGTLMRLLSVAIFLVPSVRAEAAGALAAAEIRSADGQTIGMATFTEGGQGVRVVVHVRGLDPGYHGLHLHAAGVCRGPDFKSAAGHFNPFDAEHGLRHPGGPHAGDLPNLLVDPDGIGVSDSMAHLVTLGEGGNSLFRQGGTALVIHQGPDDHRSQPSGDAGKRVGCGVIKRLGAK